MFGKRKNPLDQRLLRWSSGDYYTLSDLLRGLAVFGCTGSGKSSASALAVARAILRTNAGGLVCCSKPEDRPWWLARLKEAGRLKDAILFAEDSDQRVNFLEFESKSGKKGAIAQDLTRFLMTLSEVLDDKGGGKQQEQFWRSLNERIIYQTIVPLLAAYGTVDAPSMRRFLDSAATHPSQLNDPDWRAGFCNQTLEKANECCGEGIEAYDLAQANAFWPGEFAKMDERPRSSGLLGVNNCIHLLNSGLVRELCATTSTFTPQSFEAGKWVIADFPTARFGVVGRFLMAGLKYLTQRHVLRRTFTPGDPPIITFCDEAQNVVNSFDSAFILESRSHGGSLVYLSQGISNYVEKLGKDAADMLIGQMSHKIFHVVDPVTAKYASELVGSVMQETYGGSQQAPRDGIDEVIGTGQWSSSMSQGIRPLIEPREFMLGRTGGHANRLLVDSWVVRMGTPFRGGSTALRCVWSQT